VRLSVEGPGSTSYVQVCYRFPAASHPDFFPLSVLDSLLAGPSNLNMFSGGISNKTSRLYRRLVYEERMAVDVSAHQSSREIGSFFLVAATAAPGRTLSDVLAAIDVEIQRLAAEGASDGEIERVKAQAEAHFIYRLQTVGGFGGKSDQLNAYNVLRGEPDYFGQDLRRYQDATAESLQAAAQAYLPADRRVALSIVPRGQVALALPGSIPVAVS
jgi:zinc protease